MARSAGGRGPGRPGRNVPPSHPVGQWDGCGPGAARVARVAMSRRRGPGGGVAGRKCAALREPGEAGTGGQWGSGTGGQWGSGTVGQWDSGTRMQGWQGPGLAGPLASPLVGSGELRQTSAAKLSAAAWNRLV